IATNPELKKQILKDFETYKNSYDDYYKIKRDMRILRQLIDLGDDSARSFLQACVLIHFNAGNLNAIECILKNKYHEDLPPEARGEMFIDVNPELKKIMLEDFETYKKYYDDYTIQRDIDILQELIDLRDDSARFFLQACVLTPFKAGNLDAIEFILENGYHEVLPLTKREEMFIAANPELKKNMLKDFETYKNSDDDDDDDSKIWRDIYILRKLIDLGDDSVHSFLYICFLAPFKAGNLDAIYFILKEKYHEYLTLEEHRKMFIDANPELKKKMLEDFEIYKNSDDDSEIWRDIYILRKLIDLGDESAPLFFQARVLILFKAGNLAAIEYILKWKYYEYLPPEGIRKMFIDANPELKKNMLEDFETYKNSDDHSEIRRDIEILRGLIDLGDESARFFLQALILTSFKAGNLAAIKFILENKYHEELPPEGIRKMFIDANPELKKNMLKDFETYKNSDDDDDSKIWRDIYILRKLIDLGDDSVHSFLQARVLTLFKAGNLAAIEKILNRKYYKYLSSEGIRKMFIDANPELKKNMLEDFETYKNYDYSSKIWRDIWILRKLINLGDKSAKSFLQARVLTLFKARNLAAIEKILNRKYYKYLPSEGIRKMFIEANPELKKNILKEFRTRKGDKVKRAIQILKKLKDLGDKSARLLLQKYG
ncbi:MAG: hypothetical protein ACTSU4_12050, partial [Promethearchaeota archaeon]